jgi:hypothetical protein
MSFTLKCLPESVTIVRDYACTEQPMLREAAVKDCHGKEGLMTFAVDADGRAYRRGTASKRYSWI